MVRVSALALENNRSVFVAAGDSAVTPDDGVTARIVAVIKDFEPLVHGRSVSTGERDRDSVRVGVSAGRLYKSRRARAGRRR